MNNSSSNTTETYVAGCKRTWQLQENAPDLAYTEQAFPECPSCLHRIEADKAAPFCVLRPQKAPHPFAALQNLLD